VETPVEIQIKEPETPSQIQKSLETQPEAPTPRRRARVNYLELAGSPAKTPSRRGRSASIEGASNNVQSTPKPPRSARKLMAPIAEKKTPDKVESETTKESEGNFYLLFHVTQEKLS
jgi:hypothetical protein